MGKGGIAEKTLKGKRGVGSVGGMGEWHARVVPEAVDVRPVKSSTIVGTYMAITNSQTKTIYLTHPFGPFPHCSRLGEWF